MVRLSSCRLQSPRDKTLFSTIAQKLQDRIQAYADERFEIEWEYRDAEQTDLRPLMYATASERKDDAMALSLYAVRILSA